MQRILVIGSPGAGKSTLSRQLSERLGLPLHPLDRLWWNPGWVESEEAAFDERLAAIVATPRWVIDGNYGRTLPMRLQRADTVVYLDYPTRITLTRVLRRTFLQPTRPDMADGCRERPFTWDYLEFIRYTATFRREKRGGIVSQLAAADQAQVHAFTHPRQTQRWFATIPEAAGVGGVSPRGESP